jgi:hypothetical protein
MRCTGDCFWRAGARHGDSHDDCPAPQDCDGGPGGDCAGAPHRYGDQAGAGENVTRPKHVRAGTFSHVRALGAGNHEMLADSCLLGGVDRCR